ncbi:MFS transporter [Ligilactobacillus sp. WILCCON 0076]|uniref:MFS transporter n=1 Tax=Ligilactobacillus ubinensis TaxID=2876789 RepID=A0A9X2JLJ3_9LACO|nr:MFS transporter [Ligilactobacillus ubinensis]MCP0887067.1 MFS transporter [Ligilactobacillus ubinensis]
MTLKQVKIVTFGLLLASVIAGLDGTIINTALPAIISDLQGIEYMGWIVAVFLLGMSIFTPLWSKLGEIIGNKKAFQLSVLLFLLGALLEATARNIFFFIGARTLMGIGAGGMGALPYIIIGYIYQNINQRARVLGLISASFSIGSIVGPLLGGWIVDVFSWHWIFYINIPIGLITVFLIQFSYREEKVVSNTKFDYLGATLLVTGLMLLLIGVQSVGSLSWYYVLILLLIGIILLIWLFKVEKQVATPIIPGHLFKNTALVVDFLLFCLAWGASIAFNTYVPMWSQGLLGVAALAGGLTQIPGAITDFAGANTVPFLQRKFQDLTIVQFGLIGILISIVGLLGDVKTPYVWLLAMGAFYGFGVGLVFVTLQIRVQQDVALKDMPAATSLSYLLRILAQTFMASVYGVVLNIKLVQGVARADGRVTMSMMNKLSNADTNKNLPVNLLPQLRNILHSGMHTIMLVAASLLILALLFSFWAKRKLIVKKN